MTRLVLAPTSLMDASPLGFLEAAGAAGYDGVGLRVQASPHLPFHPLVDDAALVRAMKRELHEAGLGVLDLFTFYLRPETDVAAFAPALELGAEFGARYAVVQGNDPDWARLVDNFGRFCDMAAPLGLVATVEFMPARELATLPQSVQLLRDAGRDNVSICVDPLHLLRSGGGAQDIARVEPGLFAYAQLCDGILAPGEPDLRLLGRAEMGVGLRALPGEGTLPLRDIARTLPTDIPYSVEVAKPGDWQGSDAEWARRTLVASQIFLSEL